MKKKTFTKLSQTVFLAGFIFLLASLNVLQAQTNDVATTNQATLVGNYQQVLSGVSFYPDLTANSFDINLPTCSGGATPTIAYAYLNWQGRFRNGDTDPAPAFDDNLDVQINTGLVTQVTASFFPVGDNTSSNDKTRYHFTGFAEVTALVQASITAGSNTINVSDFIRPTGSTDINQNFGVGLTIVYECPEFPTSTLTVGAGADFFFCEEPVRAGAYSELTVFTFPTTATAITGTLEGLFGGQANATSPFRGGNICYLTGSGTPPATTMDPPEPLVVDDPAAICSTNPTWVSSLGQEWDLFSTPVTIPAGSNYLIVQGNSEVNGAERCGSLYSSTFSLVVPQNIFCAEPTTSAFAIQPSCDSDGNVPDDDGYLQISATDGLSYSVNGGTRTTLVGETFPLQVLTGLANPVADQDYTIRVYEDDIGGDADCFVDEVVTLRVQDCATGCDCKEYIYLNDPPTNEVHKFQVQADGSLIEIGSPWLAPTVPGSNQPLDLPHGIAIDLNGYLYIGDVDSFNPLRGGIVKLSCDGTVLEDRIPNIDVWGYNIGTVDNKLYIPAPRGPVRIFDICTGAEQPPITFEFADESSWGWTISKDQQFYYRATGWFDNDISQVIKGSLSDGSEEVLYNTTATNNNTFMGITEDDEGNLYVIENDNNSGRAGARVIKISPAGVLLAATSFDNDLIQNPGMTSGWFGARGITWSASSNSIYVGSREDCISTFDASDLTYRPGRSIGYVAGSDPKGLGIISECCPTSNNQSIDIVQCNQPMGDPISLNEILPCDGGTICEAQWTPVDGFAAAVYNDCNQTIMAGTATGCYSFERSSDGTGANNQCGAFYQRFTVSIANIESGLAAGGEQVICEDEEPAPVTATAATAAGGGLTYQWYSSIETDSTGYMIINGATELSYSPSAASLVSDTTYFRIISDVTTCNGMCRDTSNAVFVVVVAPTPVLEAGDAATICKGVNYDLRSNNASIGIEDGLLGTDGTSVFGATWTSSGNGDFLNAAGAVLTAPVRFNEAVAYRPSTMDVLATGITLTLTSDNPNADPFTNILYCEVLTDNVFITTLNVDCGTFPWDGSNN